jgi:hypothetical protein
MTPPEWIGLIGGLTGLVGGIVAYLEYHANEAERREAQRNRDRLDGVRAGDEAYEAWAVALYREMVAEKVARAAFLRRDPHELPWALRAIREGLFEWSRPGKAVKPAGSAPTNMLPGRDRLPE